tara:strand:- start:440 stop:586 length:147 start_codon:yes stop_codon:yes gene_type:complete
MDQGGFHNHEFNFNNSDGKKLSKKQAKYVILVIVMILFLISVVGSIFS